MLGAAKSRRAAEMERVAAEGDGASSSIDGSSGGMTGATAQAKETAAAKCKNNNDKKKHGVQNRRVRGAIQRRMM